MAAVCALYAAVILYPFRWSPPRWVENGAERIPGGWRFGTPGMLRGPAPSGDLDLRLRAKPARIDQTGPARILTISHDTSRRNLTLGQCESDLVLRLRSYDTDINAMPQHSIKRVLFPGRWTDIRLTIQGREAALFIDGDLRFSKRYDRPPLDRWNGSYRLALGNEHNGMRSWLGEIEYSGKVERPEGYWAMHHKPRLVPFREPGGVDMVLNFLGFLPFGILLVFAGWSVRTIVLTAACLSVLLELSQLALVGRYTSTTDVLLNALGALAGALIARRPAAARATTDPAARA